MTALSFDAIGSRLFESGIDHCVLYPVTGTGVAWNGITAITENVNGGEQSSVWLDSQKYLDVIANEDFQATLEALSAPSEFGLSDGKLSLAPGLFATQQPRKLFSLSYRTVLGNDTDGINHGYKLHLVYNCTASPTERAHASQSDSSSPESFSWQIDSVPPSASGYKPTAHFEINSTLISSGDLTTLTGYLYGTSGTAPYMPTQAAVIALLS